MGASDDCHPISPNDVTTAVRAVLRGRKTFRSGHQVGQQTFDPSNANFDDPHSHLSLGLRKTWSDVSEIIVPLGAEWKPDKVCGGDVSSHRPTFMDKSACCRSGS
jgi:hypothetical protein